MDDCISTDNYLKWLYKQQLMDVSLPGKRELCTPKWTVHTCIFFIIRLFQSESFKKRCYCEMCKYASIMYVCMYVCIQDVL